MRGETVDLLIRLLDVLRPLSLDLTGGAPELNPHFRRLVFAAREREIEVIAGSVDLERAEGRNLLKSLEYGPDHHIAFVFGTRITCLQRLFQTLFRGFGQEVTLPGRVSNR